MKKIREYVLVCKSDMPIPRKEAAARELWTLALNNDYKLAIVTAGAIGALVLLCRQPPSGKCAEYGARALWNLAINTENKIAIAEVRLLSFFLFSVRPRAHTSGLLRRPGRSNL